MRVGGEISHGSSGSNEGRCPGDGNLQLMVGRRKRKQEPKLRRLVAATGDHKRSAESRQPRGVA